MAATAKNRMNDESDALIMLYLADGTAEERRAALGELYVRHGEYLYHKVILPWCRRRGYDDSVASDLIQELLLHLTKKASKFHSGDDGGQDVERRKIRAWMGQVFENLAKDLMRKAHAPFYPTSITIDGEFDLDELPCEESTSDDDVSLQMSELQKAMDHLGEKERDVVRAYMMEKDPKNHNARFKQGVSQEIAANLNISKENLRQTYHRAIKKLKKHLEQIA